mgnify:CR=1 FL=1
MSGKEATVYTVRCGSEVRCAKVYKDAAKRSFKKAVQYQEGRKVRNSRRARAMEKGSKFGREQQEKIWQSAEVDALRLLAQAGVRVPKPYDMLEGVLLMELVTDDEGDVAPRLSDVVMSAEQAEEDHALMMQYVVRMLCAGIIHGDLSEFNVLVDDYGPVIDDIYEYAEIQGIEIDGITQEGGAGQLEINLKHGDPIALADQVFFFKRRCKFRTEFILYCNNNTVTIAVEVRLCFFNLRFFSLYFGCIFFNRKIERSI